MSQKDLANILGTDKAKKRRIDEGLLKEKIEKERKEEEEKAKKVRGFFFSVGWNQKYSRLRQPLQKFSFLFKAKPVYEGRLKVILLLQVSSRDFEPTYLYYILAERLSFGEE